MNKYPKLWLIDLIIVKYYDTQVGTSKFILVLPWIIGRIEITAFFGNLIIVVTFTKVKSSHIKIWKFESPKFFHS
jgi:hypothetical protein